MNMKSQQKRKTTISQPKKNSTTYGASGKEIETDMSNQRPKAH